MRKLITILALSLGLFSLSARADEATHAAINKVYTDMSAAYTALDVAAMGRIYTAEAAYLQPGPQGAVGEVGREGIVGGFKQFFEGAKAKGDKLDIDFRVVSRTLLNPTTAVDLGHFLLTVTPAQGQPQRMAGTFITVPTRQADGSWAFAADSYGPTKVDTYNSAPKTGNLKYDG